MISWATRISLFLDERMRIKAFLPLVLILVYCHNILIRNNFSLQNYLLASLFYLVVITLMRICDEFKDYHADLKNFPQRCIPRGAVSLKDIKIFFIVLTAVILPLLLFTLKDYTLLIVLIVYLFLFAKFFFIPHILEKNIIAALITHNPILLIIHLVIIQTLLNTTTINTLEHLSTAVFFWLFPLCWEIARKIRLPKNETEYVTYSRSLGHVASLVLLIVLIITQLYLYIKIVPDLIYLAIPSLYLLYLFSRFLLFIKRETDNDEKQIIQSYEIYTFMSYINILIIHFIL